MFNLNDSLRYFLYSEPTDMRKSFHTLAGIVRNAMGQNPCDGSVYIFLNRPRNRIKLLHWEAGDVMFYYDGGSRAHSVARSILSGFQGTIQCDGYEAYDQFENKVGFTVCGCWAHTRKKYTDALDKDRENASKGILAIAKLYAVEEDCKDMTPEERAKVRQEKSYPVIKELEKWIMELYPKVLPKSRIGKALAYTYSLLPRLSRYVNDGRTNIDNNLIENDIRPFAIGRKNYLFCGNDASAYRAAIAYSLIATCKSAGVEPRTWMEDVLHKIPYYQRDNKDLGELLPRHWRLAHTSS
ncbi:MAG: IS66 family transposase [Paludibacteraceae bacterium]|nr:IS66 family transposase [Paludibacteraceae bacterium]